MNITYPIKVYAITEEDVKKLKDYLATQKVSLQHSGNLVINNRRYVEPNTYIWLNFTSPKTVNSRQNILDCYLSRDNASILEEYFTPKLNQIPVNAFLNPSAYPEHFI